MKITLDNDENAALLIDTYRLLQFIFKAAAQQGKMDILDLDQIFDEANGPTNSKKIVPVFQIRFGTISICREAISVVDDAMNILTRDSTGEYFDKVVSALENDIKALKKIYDNFKKLQAYKAAIPEEHDDYEFK